MAALSTYTGTTELTEIIPTELIDEFVAAYEYFPTVADAICWTRPGQGSIAVRFPRFNRVGNGSGTPAGTKTQTDTFTDVLIDTTEESITPGLVGMRLPLSDEAMAMTIQQGGISASILAEALNDLRDRMDIDILASSTSATNSIGAITDNFTAAAFRAAIVAYRALKLRSAMGHAAVLHSDAFRDLDESLSSSGAQLTSRDAMSLSFGPESGYMGEYRGFQVFQTGNVAAETTGWSNFFTPIGVRNCGIGAVITEMPNIRRTRGDEAELRATDFYVARCWYGAGMTNRRRVLEVLSRT